MRLLALIAFLLLRAIPAAASEEGVTVEGPWIRLAPPEARVMAGYGLLRNPGSSDRVLVGAESEAFGAIEIHETYEQDGLMRMRRLSELPIPAGGAVALKPGGPHLMLFRPSKPLPEGAEVPIRLRFSEGEEQVVVFTVRAEPPG
ncbi:MAG: hypothetical protein KatS3mg125_1896 [Lysobacterales bacterium]|jgi:copper(I)-binding protein|nr:MAG: hypothetical protein KatS3mg125_1896 [Xanthomonadales bacterium]